MSAAGYILTDLNSAQAEITRLNERIAEQGLSTAYEIARRLRNKEVATQQSAYLDAADWCELWAREITEATR